MRSPTSLGQVGPYRLLSLLGKGGMGEVYEAVHKDSGQRVALKILSPESARDPQTVARFVKEAGTLVALRHPGVVEIFHSDKVDGTAYFTMELLEGLSLRAWMERGASLQASLAICAQIAAVMADIHARDTIHRDLKPENVFLAPDESVPPGYRVKLLDFGIAKSPPPVDVSSEGATLVDTGMFSVIGTVQYMAPEQFQRPSAVDGRADVYSLGIMLYEMLTSRTPFPAKGLVEQITMHLCEGPRPLKEMAPATPAALSVFVSSMLAKVPAERPSMSRCRDMLGRSWEGQVDACPVPGLAHFTESQAELFFGRKAETDAILRLLEEARTGTRRWVQLEGVSGVGKSSLVYAGVLPLLKELSARSTPGWHVVTMRPSDEPIRNLARALAASGTGSSPEQMEQKLRSGPGGLLDAAGACTPAGHRLLLVIEQAEELFTLGAAEADQFDALLATALSGDGSAVRLLTSIRSDFLHRLEQLPRLARLLNAAARYHLQPMGEQALMEVIQGMARNVGLRLSEGLAQRMVADARGEGGRLPLLGHALRGLWMLSGGAELTHEHYERLGGVGGALARQAVDLLGALGAEGRERAKSLLLELVQVGRGVPDTRRPRRRDEVLEAAGGDRLAEEVLLRLTGSGSGEQQGLRILTLSGEAEPSRQTVELAHETLLQKVPALAGWIEAERTSLEREKGLDVAAADWEEAGCPKDGLPTGTLLKHYQGGLRARRQVNSRAARFLRAAERLERRRNWLRGGVVVSLLAATMATTFYAVQADRTQNQIIELADQFVGTTDWELGRLPGTLPVRRKMHDAFLDKISSLPKWKSRVRRLITRALHRRSDLAFQDETLDSAEALQERARAEIQGVLESQPRDPDFNKLSALNHSKLSKVAFARGDPQRARDHAAESVRILQEYRAPLESDDSMDYWQTLGISYADLAEAESDLQLKIQYLDLAAHCIKNTGDRYSRTLLALVRSARGLAASREEDLLSALQLATESVKETKNQPTRSTMARVQVAYGQFLARANRREEAQRILLEALKYGEEARQGEPENKRYTITVAEALQELEKLVPDGASAMREPRCRMISEHLARDEKDNRLKVLACDSRVLGR